MKFIFKALIRIKPTLPRISLTFRYTLELTITKTLITLIELTLYPSINHWELQVKKMKKLHSLFAIITLLLASAASMASEISLLNARILQTGSAGGGSVYTGEVTGHLLVENLTYHKEIDIFWNKAGSEEEWQVTPAYYLGPSEIDGYEVWKFDDIPLFWSGVFCTRYLWETHCTTEANPSVQFAIRYRANGSEYWDNNNWNDYVVERKAPLLLDNELIVDSARIGTLIGCEDPCKGFFGNVLVKNLAYDKNVTVFFSVNGAEWLTAPAIFDKMVSEEFERWKWEINVTDNLPVVFIEYAVRYEVNGETYWDNNYLLNYRVD